MSDLSSNTVSAALPSRPLVLLLAAMAGLGVATIYYSQPILAILGPDLHAGAGELGLIPMLTQLGYALGILLLAPLGDRFDRRYLIVGKSALLAAALLVGGASTGIGSMLAVSLAVGIAATLAQDVVPTAATLAPDAHRGRVVGTVMTGLLLGILLSRVASGLIAAQFGWRVVFQCGAASIAIVGVAAMLWLPGIRPASRLGYGALLLSLASLWRHQPALRRAVFAQGLLSLAFSAFWSTLAVMLQQNFGLGSAVAGAFGLAGAAGALAAPLAGRMADRRGTEFVTRLGALVVMLSFAAMGTGLLLPAHAQLVVLVCGTVGFDFGVQISLVGHQSQVYGLDAAARSRLNALLLTGMFIGMAAGAALGSLLFAQRGWFGVVVLCTLAAAAALVVRLTSTRR
jgi:predicted MFS family arabinose efflux permease